MAAHHFLKKHYVWDTDNPVPDDLCVYKVTKYSEACLCEGRTCMYVCNVCMYVCRKLWKCSLAAFYAFSLIDRYERFFKCLIPVSVVHFEYYVKTQTCPKMERKRDNIRVSKHVTRYYNAESSRKQRTGLFSFYVCSERIWTLRSAYK
jgi:hypothetical protein